MRISNNNLDVFKLLRKEITKSNCLKRKYVAAIVAECGGLLSLGTNRTVEGVKPCEKCNRLDIPNNTLYVGCKSIHAEQMAIIRIGKYFCNNGVLYLYGINNDGSTIHDIQPCTTCKKLIIESGIKKVIAASNDVLIEYDIKQFMDDLNKK